MCQILKECRFVMLILGLALIMETISSLTCGIYNLLQFGRGKMLQLKQIVALCLKEGILS